MNVVREGGFWGVMKGGALARYPVFYFFVQIFFCALFAIAPFVLGLSGGFLLDDWANIVGNTSLHLVSPLSIEKLLYAAYSFEPGGGSRPLSMLSFALDFWRAGLDATAFKTTNLIIHGLNSLVLLFFFRQLLELSGWGSRSATHGAMLMAMFWAVHPLQVSSVLYVVQRMQILGALFVLLAMLAYLQTRISQIEGKSGRVYGISTLLFWVLAFAAKEDSIMLPVYTLLLEVTLLRFRARSSVLAERWRRIYLVIFIVSLFVYCFYVVPHYWHWQNYPGRDFSTPDRLLTQGRVLVMYLAQIFLPFQSSIRFFYDDLEVSRGVWQPLTTAPALLLILSLMLWAWHWRRSRPLFSLGVLLYFSGHLITSNVIGLELAFEHRNYFSLVGLVLAAGDLLTGLFQRLRMKLSWRVSVIAALLLSFGLATGLRAHIWGDNLRLAEHALNAAPNSERAWAFLSSVYFERSKQKRDSPDLKKAISACRNGMDRLPESAILANNLLIFRSVQGNEADNDWAEFLDRFQRVLMSPQNKGILWVTLGNAERGVLKNEDGVLKTIEIVTEKVVLRSTEYLRIGAYVFNQTEQPDKAFPYLRRAVQSASMNDPSIKKMFAELAMVGKVDWVNKLQEAR